MRNNYDDWLDRNAGAQAWTGRLLAMAAAGIATAAVWLSVALMAGLGLPAGELAAAAQTRAVATAAPASAVRSVRYAAALPPVTIVGRREAAVLPSVHTLGNGATAVLPARTASVGATVGISATGDNLRQ